MKTYCSSTQEFSTSGFKMITITITRKQLTSLDACAEGLAYFNSIAGAIEILPRRESEES
jgi:hypothetical protein